MGDNNASGEDATVTFHVKAATGPKYTFTLPLSTTTIDLKNKLAEPDSANVPAASQRLIYSGKVLKDSDTLAQYNVKEGNTMHLVRSAASNQRQNPANQSSTSSTTSASQVPPGAGVPQNLSSGTGNDPLAGLTGARYAGFAGLPSLQELANPPTPEEMIRRLQDPNFAQQMNEALSNPQLIDMMIQQNPQLRAMGPQARQILQSEDFRRMMTNPDYIRSMMNMQNMMGGGFGGMGGGNQAFPMPGATTTTDEQHQEQAQTPNQQPGTQNQQNPFASMFGQGMANPFMFPPPQQTPATGSTDGSRDNQQQAQANPFAALFAPNATQGQPGQTQTDGNNPTGANPFANNPFLSNAYQNMMNNPQALQNAMQMLGMGGGAGGANPFAMLGGDGGFRAPPDNRPPEERYATQLRQLNEMGFFNYDQNIQALTRSGGDVNGALEWLFSQPPS